VYVCTNISCSLRGANALYEAVRNAVEDGVGGNGVGGNSEFNVRAFECLGACDIAPMASVDGVFVGPLTPEDVPQLLDDVRAGRPVLPDKQLSTRKVADPHANSREFPAHAVETASPSGASGGGTG
jgi:NADH-quinone oxidoreductase subunit E